MNPDPTSNRPGDEAHDPLLTALQQHLGRYGEAPPPGAWASIRQQLAAPRPAVRPWWRRPRRALPALALLLLLLATTGGLVHQWRLRRSAEGPGHALLRHGLVTAESPLPSGASAPTATRRHTGLTATRTPTPTAPTAKGPAAVTPRQPSSPAVARLGEVRSPGGPVGAGRTTRRRAERATFTQRSLAGHPDEADQGRAASAQPEATLLLAKPRRKPNGWPEQRLTRQKTDATATRPTAASLATGGLKRRIIAAGRPTDLLRQDEQKEASSPRVLHAPPALAGPETEGIGPRTRTPRRRRWEPKVFGASLDSERYRPDSLGLRRPSLVLALAPARPSVTAGPDSARHTPPPARRWALLLLAGPTLSYRTLGTSADSAARTERPAAGLGAQLQLRRVLSGRWALAAGFGYQEYATRLMLRDSVAGPVPVRNTYRLLTAPVQVSYALGVPQGRWATSVLAGAEVGWYRGGRSTEGSNCNCQQLTSTAGPYHSWNLAFSLGLDVRYRLGGPDSRWRWVVQPTGRYVVTPFVRPGPGAVGFAARQPFSLGVLTGFSWDLR